VSAAVQDSCWLSPKNVTYEDQHRVGIGSVPRAFVFAETGGVMMILLLLFLQKQSLVNTYISW
jgi:hypothetical protein